MLVKFNLRYLQYPTASKKLDWFKRIKKRTFFRKLEIIAYVILLVIMKLSNEKW